MGENENKGNHPADALSNVAVITPIGIVRKIVFRVVNEHKTEQGMKEDWQKDEDPLHHHQRFAQAVNLIDDILERLDPVNDRGVGRKVNHHVQADRDQAT
jgi:hypothetical protein